MIKAKFHITGEKFNLVRIVYYLEKKRLDSSLPKDKTEKRYLVRSPKFETKNVDVEYDLEIPTYFSYGLVIIDIKNIGVFSRTRDFGVVNFNKMIPGLEKEYMIGNAHVTIYFEPEVFNYPKNLPSGIEIRSPFFHVPMISKPPELVQYVALIKMDAKKNQTNNASKLKFDFEKYNGEQYIEVELHNLDNFPDQNIIHRSYNLRKFNKQRLGINEFTVALPCFYTESDLNLEIHCCVESPQYGEDDWVQPHISEHDVAPLKWKGSGPHLVFGGAAFFCYGQYSLIDLKTISQEVEGNRYCKTALKKEDIEELFMLE